LISHSRANHAVVDRAHMPATTRYFLVFIAAKKGRRIIGGLLIELQLPGCDVPAIHPN